MALAGFTPEEISVTAEQNLLTVEGRKGEKDDREYLHQGISRRAFRRQFNLADYVGVTGAYFEKGAPADRLGARAPGSDETAPDRNQIRLRSRPAANRAQTSRLSDPSAVSGWGFGPITR